MLDVRFGEFLLGMLDDVVYAAEMIHGLYDIIHMHLTLRKTNGVCLKDISRLFVREPASLDMIGVISKVYLCLMIDSALHTHLFLLAKDGKQL